MDTNLVMKNYKNLFIFDLDGTLMNTPLPEEGKKQWSAHYKKAYPRIGWWSYPESLDSNVFDIKPNLNVVSDFIKAKKDPDGLCVMLTSRLPKLESQIMQLLNKHLLFFDIYLFKKFNKMKCERVEEILNKYPTIEYVEFWEDRNSEIAELNEWQESRPDLSIKINHVKNV